MTDVQPFDASFEALTGHSPMRWQRRLFEEFSAGRIPDAVDLPTGLGKTSVMAIWLIALAAQAAAGRVSLPRRLIYVVDRRTVVDQATAFAERLQRQAGILGEPFENLPISTLRGQHVDNRRWIDDPSRAAIVIGTVDMIGSRLLFQGYGASRGMRPYQAGLLGADTLFVLDEAHLCPPFEALLRAAVDDPALKPVSGLPVPAPRLMSLSATGRAGGRVFRLAPEDDEDAVVVERREARKVLRLDDLEPGKKLEEVLAERAFARAQEGPPARVVVFCNSRKVAQGVAATLEKRKDRDSRSFEPLLLTGARRVHEREKLAKQLKDVGYVADYPRSPVRPAILVATSAGEVGVDLDADHMVSDLVACERMIQRLGRVNRCGGASRCASIEVVVALPTKASKTESDAEAAARVARWRTALGALPLVGDDEHDASPAAFAALKAAQPDLIAAASTPEPLRPPLTRALVDAWSMTSLDDHPGRPDIQPWLRGWIDDEDPQTRVIWRVHLPWRKGATFDPKEAAAFFDAAPPHLHETLEIETPVLIDVLAERVKKVAGHAQPDGSPVAADTPALIVLDRRGKPISGWTLGELAACSDDKRRERDLEAALRYGTAVVWAGLGGLDGNGGLSGDGEAMPCLDNDWNGEADAESILENIGYRVLSFADELPKGWRETLRLVIDDRDEDRPEGIVVAEWIAEPGRTNEIAENQQTLAEHTKLIVEEIRRLGKAFGLPSAFVDMLVNAARWHDAGKACDLWQSYAGNPGFRAGRGEALAKFTGRGDPRILGGYRHEFGSLPHAEAAPGHRELSEDLRELALHLIAAHHGRARPLIAPIGPDAPPSVLAARARDVALRFARLQRVWGPWGLVWWETLLRSADHRASRRLDAKEELPRPPAKKSLGESV